MCLAYNTKLFLLSGKEVTIEELYNSDYSNEWTLACDLENKKVQPVKIQKVIQKDFIPDKLISITLDNGKTINVTDNHLILCRDGQYRRADELHEEDSLMPFDFYNEFRHKDYYRKVINPFGIKAGIPITNHKIVRIERIRNNKPVYDLQLNEIHNFGIDAGIFVHNCDGLAGSLYNASISVKPEEMYNMEDYSVVMEVNPVSPFDISDNPANEMFDFVPKPKEQNTVVETDSFNDQINKDIENQNDIVKNLRDKLSAAENRKVSDDELLGALFNKDDNIIIF